jgi:hypothetical protein
MYRCIVRFIVAPLVSLGILLLVMGCTPSVVQADPTANTLTDKERADGWKLLFDGKTTQGWRKYKGKEVPDKWKVVDGTLVFQPKGGKSGGDIVTVDQFDNFDLVLEWKISAGGNSGLIYRVSEEFPAPWQTGPEYQLLDNAKHPDGKNPLTSAGSAYAVYAPVKDVIRPVGEWNQTRLLVNGNHVEHWLNGVKVVEYELGSDDWQKRVQASKFNKFPRYGRETKGHIDLQDHGNEIAFRNIKIRPVTTKSEK